MNTKNLLIILALCATYACSQEDQPNPYHGEWFGILDLGEQKFRLALQFNSLDSASCYLLNPKAESIAVDTLYLENDSLKITMSEIDGAYTCRYVGDKLQGKWKLANDRWVDLAFEPADFSKIEGFRPRLDDNYSYQAPQPLDGDWLTSSLEKEGMDQSPVLDLVHAIIDEKYKNIHSLLIVKNNKLVLEEYFYGYTRADLNGIQSASKSFWSALLGVAIAQGAIKGVHQSICPYFKEYRSFDCHNLYLTLHHLLTMTTGWKWDETSVTYGDPENSSDQMVASEDPLWFTLSRPVNTSPGNTFNYNSGCMLLINKILWEATNTPNDTFAIQNLLRPLGITTYDLGDDFNGVLGDIYLLPRDMARFGTLFLNEGQWDGTQILPKAWVQASTTKQVATDEGDAGYGYFWWTRNFTKESRPVPTYYAWGYGGQYIFVVPEINMVTVFTGSNWKMSDNTYFEIVDEYLVE